MFCDIIDVSHDPRVLSMWKALRVIVFHFMRPMAEHAQPAAVAQVQQHLQHNSRLVQEVFGPAYCNYKLHMINCRAIGQQQARGLTGHGSEFWVENCIQDCKGL